MKIREILREDVSVTPENSIKISAILSQIASRIEDTGSTGKMALKSVLNILNDSGVNISERQFRDMVDQEPISNIVASIEGNHIIFLGDESQSSKSIKPEKSSSTLEKMAKRASKKKD